MVFCVGHTKRTPDVNQSCCAVCMCRFCVQRSHALYPGTTQVTTTSRYTGTAAGSWIWLPSCNYTVLGFMLCYYLFSFSLHTHTQRFGNDAIFFKLCHFFEGKCPSEFNTFVVSVYVCTGELWAVCNKVEEELSLLKTHRQKRQTTRTRTTATKKKAVDNNERMWQWQCRATTTHSKTTEISVVPSIVPYRLRMQQLYIPRLSVCSYMIYLIPSQPTLRSSTLLFSKFPPLSFYRSNLCTHSLPVPDVLRVYTNPETCHPLLYVQTSTWCWHAEKYICYFFSFLLAQLSQTIWK